ncbi:hypothetical protein [Benzoatithermus flavus]|uniref:Uncharacterized protein n=1 Tax=Benzoatithermus flavus TaxID=3108223 RepID=A0ABU8XR27_9PROT
MRRHEPALGRTSHRAGSNNQFQHLLAEAGLAPRLLRPEERQHVPSGLGIGLTNLVMRPDQKRRRSHAAGAARRRPAGCALGLQQDAPFPLARDFVLPSPSELVRTSFAEKLVWYRGLARLAAAR